MRKRFVYFVLIPLLIVGVIVSLCIDRWVEMGLEAAGEKMAGAKVEIDNLRVTFMPVGIRWERMQVADPNNPWLNIFETRGVEFALNAGQLLRGKYIVETMGINELILGTKRTTDGSLRQAPEATSAAGNTSSFTALAREALDKTVEKTPLTGIDLARGGFNADSLVRVLDVRTLRYVDSVRQQVLTTSQQWEKAVAEFETSRKTLTEIEGRVTAINPSQLKDVEGVTAAISTVDNAVKAVHDISGTFAGRKTSIENDIKVLSASLAGVEKTAGDDLTRLKGMARLPNLNSSGIARMLVGEEMYARALSYLHWIDFAREHIKNYRGKPEQETPPRMKGQNIRFPVNRAYPTFWIKRAFVSGGTDSTTAADYVHARGQIDNITDDQMVTGMPMTASLTGVEGEGKTFALTARFDRTREIPFDEYSGMLGGVPLAAFRLGNAGFLDATLSGGKINSTIKVSVPGSAFDATSSIALAGFAVRFGGEPGSLFENLVRETLRGIDRFTVGLRLWKTDGGFDVALSTDLDTKISERAQGVLGAAFAKAQAELKAKLDGVIAEKRAGLERLVTAKRTEVEKFLGEHQVLIDQKLAAVEAKKKELTDRLEKEKQGKVNDLLKGIFKK